MFMWKNAHEQYLEGRVASADPLELVRLLYDAAIASVREARRALAAGEILARSRAISKASGIVIELNSALDHAQGGDLSRRLAALYDYVLRRLLEANLQQTDAPLEEVWGLLSTLAEGWNGIHRPAEASQVSMPWQPAAEPAAVGAAHAWSL